MLQFADEKSPAKSQWKAQQKPPAEIIAGRGQAYVRYSRHDEAAKCLAANPFTEDLSVP